MYSTMQCTVCHQNGRVQKSETLQEDSTTSDQEALFTACQSSTLCLRVNGRTLNYGEDEVRVGCSEPAENDAGCWALIADKTMNLLKREQLVVVIPLSLSRWRWCTKAAAGLGDAGPGSLRLTIVNHIASRSLTLLQTPNVPLPQNASMHVRDNKSHANNKLESYPRCAAMPNKR